jgi:hypothetical protein
MSKLWEKTKKAGHNVGHSVTNVVSGPKHRTKDEHFNELTHKLEEHRKRLEALQKDVTAFLSSTEAMIAAIESVSLASLALTSTPGNLKYLCEQEIATLKKIREDKKEHLEPQMHEQFVKPLVAYLNQYRELHSRVHERNKRKDDMDKLKEKRDKLSEKNDPKAGDTNPKYNVARQSYDDLNDELIKEMPLLMEDTEKFLAPLVALFIKNKTTFIQAMSAHMASEAQSLDLSVAHVPQVNEVISAKPNSAMTRQYQPQASSYQYQADPSPVTQAGPSPRAMGGTSPRTSSSYGAPSQPVPQPYAAYPPAGPSPRGSGYGPNVPARASSQAPVPPPRAPQAKALWDFQGQPGELTFKAGDTITIHSSQGDWWQGEIPGRGRGAFPGNYVQML